MSPQLRNDPLEINATLSSSDPSTPARRRRHWVAIAGLAVLTSGLLVACSDSDSSDTTSTTATTGAATSNEQTDLRAARYCEIIPVTREGAIYVAEIYNTIGYNDCPEDKWVTITEEEVNADYGSEEAKINGPRFWAFDTLIGSGSSTGGKTYVFGGPDGIEMQVRGSLETKPREGTVGEEFYTVNEVGRDTIFVYDADQLVFELTDPEGQVYMMQSYAQIADKTLTYDQLATMGSKLDLPEGWTYASRMLTERFELNTDVSDGKAFVINDNLYNSYQRRVEG